MRTLPKSLTAFLLLIAGAVLGIGYLSLTLPNVSTIKNVELQVPLRIFTKDHQLINVYGEKLRIPVKLEAVPKSLIEAFLATEDQRFFEHSGVDVIGLFRASFSFIRTGTKAQGASTITMQLARNFYLSRTKTFARKLREILLALKIERVLNKQQILELYLNQIYLGERAYGIAAAAQVYYGKSLDELTLAQLAVLAGLPKAPSTDNPVVNSQAALKRRNHVLTRMLDKHYITPKVYRAAIAEPITAQRHGYRVEVEAPYLAEMVRASLVDKLGPKAYSMGLTVATTLDSKLQLQANQSLKRGLLAYTKRHGYRGPVDHFTSSPSTWRTLLQERFLEIDAVKPAVVFSVAEDTLTAQLADGQQIELPWSGLSWARRQVGQGFLGAPPKTARDIAQVGDVIYVMKAHSEWQLTQLPEVQGAFVALNPQNGAILALTGGFDYRLSRFNRAAQAQRQPGSSFKPFIYAAALAQGVTLATTFNDAPIVLKEDSENGVWRPHNDQEAFYGLTRVRTALSYSRNLVSIRLLQAIGIEYTRDFLKRFEFESETLPPSLSMALGSGTITPLKLTVAYATFANGGYKVLPYFIEQITNEGGTVLFQAKPAIACSRCPPHSEGEANLSEHAPQILPSDITFLINSTLQDVIQHGTGSQARSLNRSDLAGKTGTTNDRQDAWFVGYVPDLVATVWVGFDQPKPLHEYGAQLALPIWMEFMAKALEGKPLSVLKPPPGIVSMRIDPKTGLAAPPNHEPAIFEYFQKDHLPNDEASEKGISDEEILF